MKKLQSVSLFATASVLALTTVAYMPIAGAIDNTSNVVAQATCGHDVIDGTTVADFMVNGDSILLSGTCSYSLGNISDNDLNKTITLVDGANITLTLTEDSKVNGGKIDVQEGTTLTVKSTLDGENPVEPAASLNITNSGTLSIDGANITKDGTNSVITNKEGGTTTIQGESIVSEVVVEDGQVEILDGAITNLSITDGQVSIQDGIIEGNLIATKGKVTIEGGTIGTSDASEIKTTDNSQIDIKGGTIDGKLTGTLNKFFATGGEYYTANYIDEGTNKLDTSIFDTIIADRTSYRLYPADETDREAAAYLVIEPIITTDSITFADIELTEGADPIDFIGATIEGSATDFEYTNYNNAVITINNGKISATEAGEYEITATPTFDKSVSQTATIKVKSVLEDFTMKPTDDDNTSNAVKARFTDDEGELQEIKDGDTIKLYTKEGASEKLSLDLTKTAAGAFSRDVLAIAQGSAEGVVRLTQNTLTIEAIGSGSTQVTVTATAGDNTTVVTKTINIEVYDKVVNDDFEGVTIAAAQGNTFNLVDLVIVNEDENRLLDVDSFTYSAENIDGIATVDNDAGTVEIVGTNKDNNELTVKITDGSGTEAVVKPIIKTIETGDLIVKNDDTAITTEPIVLKEDGASSAAISADVTPRFADTDIAFQFVEVKPEVDEQGELTGKYVELDEGDASFLNIAADDNDPSKAEVTAKSLEDTADGMAYLRVTVNGGVEKIVKFNILAEFSAITILDENQEEVTTATIDTPASKDLSIAMQESQTFFVSRKSTNAPVDLSIETDNANVVLVKDEDSFTITGNNAGTATVTVIARSTNDVKATATLNVTVSETPVVAPLIEDGVYIIKSNLDNSKVIDITNASVDEGANVQLYSANSTIAQKFIFRANSDNYYTIENMKSGKVLTVDGENVIQAAATEAGATDGTQLWQVAKLASGNYSIISKATGNVLDVTDGETTDGTNIGVHANNGTASQQFILKETAKVTATAPIEDGTYTINSILGKNLSLDVTGRSTQDGANTQLYTTNGTPAQSFTFERNADTGFYTIYTGTVEGEGRKVLDVAGAGLVAGTNVNQWTANGTIAQQWLVIDNEDGTYSIASRCNGLYLDISGAGTANGTNVQIWDNNGTNAQKFNLTPEQKQ